MKIGVIGAGGRLGGKIAAIALDRGEEVTAIVRSTPCRDARAAVLRKSLFDLTREDAAGFDALISAYGSGFGGDPDINRRAIAHLAEITRNTGIHLILTGGAGCLFTGETGETCVYEEPRHPPFLKGISKSLAEGYTALTKETAVEYTFVCPPLTLDENGPCTGDYLTGTDRRVLFNEDGNSYVSYDDLAGAMVDFAQNGQFRKKLVTVVSRKGGHHAS